MNTHTSASPQVLRCTGTADFLAALPQLAGFTASHSLFVIFFSGSRARDAMRVDLPPDDTPKQCAELLEFLSYAITNYGAAHGATSAPAIALMTEQSFAECGGPPWSRLAHRIDRRLRRDGIHLRELCVQASDGWVSFLDQYAPRSGRSLDDIFHSPITAAARRERRSVPTLDELGAIPTPDPDRKIRAAEHLSGLLQLSDSGSVSVLVDEEAQDRVSLAPAVVRELQATPTQISPATSARVAFVLAASHSWWHVAMGIITRPEFPAELASELGAGRLALLPVDEPVHGPSHGTAPIPASNRVHETPLDLPGCSMRSLLAAVCPEFRHRDRLTPLRENLARVISEVPPSVQPGTFALSALVWWLCGNQTIAYRHIDQALKISSEHQIAGMVRRLIAVPLSAPRITPGAVTV